MTTKRHITIEVSDLTALHIQCGRCQSVLAIPIAKIDGNFRSNAQIALTDGESLNLAGLTTQGTT